MTTTTIRVPTEVREKLAELSNEEGRTMGQFVQNLVEEYEKQQFFKGLAEDFRRLQSDPEEWADYQRDLAEWDTVLMDGLEDEPTWENE
jgi:predicted DNA-binding protein